jgi:membrane protease YdiL (CAAX protease family)
MDERPQPAASPSKDEPAQREAQLPLWPPQESAGETEPSASPSSSESPHPPPAGSTSVPEQPSWRLSDLGLFIVFAIITFLFANAAATGVFLLLRRSLGGNLRPRELLAQTPFIVLMQVIWESLWLLFIYHTVAVKYRQPFWQGIRWLPTPPGPRFYFLSGIVLAGVAQGVFSLFPSEKNLPIERLFSSTGSAYLLALFGICIAPFVEEMVFRGFFYPVFERLWGFVAAVLFTALLFALIHAPQLGGGLSEMAAIYCVGVALSYARGKTGSVLPSYLMHLGYNATLFVSLFFTTNHFHTLQG